MATIGFIGLGNMGGGMAANLAKKGHDVRAFDLSKDALNKAVEAGCLAAGTVREAVSEAEFVITMLPAGQHVRAVYEGDIFEAAPASALLIDCSTIDMANCKAVGAAAGAKGFAMLDAPVSGGVGGANAGTLTFMVGGSAEHFARAEPVLALMAKAVIHAGAYGSGQAVKVVNNMILGATMIATCEGFVMAQKLGLDPQTFYDIASKATGQSWSMTTYCPVPGVGPTSPADNDYDGGFASALMLKDLKLATEAANGVGASIPMGAHAETLYQAFTNLGGGGKDFSAIIKLLDGSFKAA